LRRSAVSSRAREAEQVEWYRDSRERLQPSPAKAQLLQEIFFEFDLHSEYETTRSIPLVMRLKATGAAASSGKVQPSTFTLY
jgi:hypothetical protein